MTMKHTVLFDMDGTLTQPRKKIGWSTVVALRELQKHAHIGIVSGSPFEYIKQQMSMAWSEINSLDPYKLSIMPCNGTKLYEFTKNKNQIPAFEEKYSVSMINHMGMDVYRVLISVLTDMQNIVVESVENLPVSGNFISFRGSMVNWCMIGRDASDAMRNEFISLDSNLRRSLKASLDDQLHDAKIDDIDTALGGSTSIDIYPKGWDKTYCLRHINTQGDIYFVGDKCKPGGNDFELYNHADIISYESTDPAATHDIINDITSRIIQIG